MQTITVDMTPGFRQPTIHYSQNDVGTTFAIDLRSRFGDTLPASPTVKIQATKPSGFGFSIEADSVVDSVATFTTVATMTDEAGRFLAELEVSDSGVVLYTANFYMEGEANPHPIGTTDGSQETIIPTLTLLVKRVEAAAASVLDMTVNATTLAAGSQATYSYDEDTNTATFGIPQGEAGAGSAGVVANAYSASSTYVVGDYVIHNSNLYRCTTAITTAESFTAAHWTQVVLGDDVSDLKSDLSNIEASGIHNYSDEIVWEGGSYVSFTVGQPLTKNDSGTYPTTRRRPKSPIALPKCTVSLTSGYSVQVLKVNETTISASLSYANYFELSSGTYAFVVKKDDGTAFSTEDINAIVTIVADTVVSTTKALAETNQDNIQNLGTNGFIDITTTIDWELGSYSYINAGQSVNKFDSSTRKRTVNVISLPKTRLTVDSSYQILPVMVNPDGTTIAGNLGYGNSFELQPSKYIFVVKANNDSAMAKIDIHQITEFLQYTTIQEIYKADYNIIQKQNQNIAEFRELKNSIDNSLTALMSAKQAEGNAVTITVPSVGAHGRYLLHVLMHYGDSSRAVYSSQKTHPDHDIWFDGDCRTDFSDVRFFDSNGNMLKAEMGKPMHLDLIPDYRVSRVLRNTSQGYMVGYNNGGVQLSKNNATSFTSLHSEITGAGGDVYHRTNLYPVFVDSADNIYAYVGGHLYKLYASDDYATIHDVCDFTWTNSNSETVYPEILDGAFAQIGNTLVFGIYQGTSYFHVDIYTSTDLGETWSKTFYDYDGQMQHVHFVKADTHQNKFYVCIDDSSAYYLGGRILTSTNGTSWTNITNNIIETRGKDFYASYAGDGYRLGSAESYLMGSATLYRSTDDVHFDRVVKGCAGVRSIVDVGDDSMLVCGTQNSNMCAENHLLCSVDQGKTWESFYTLYQGLTPLNASGAGFRHCLSAKQYATDTEECMLLRDSYDYIDKVPAFRAYLGGNNYCREAFILLENVESGDFTITAKSGYAMEYPYKTLRVPEHSGLVYSIPLNEGAGKYVHDSLGNIGVINGAEYEWSGEETVRYGDYCGERMPMVIAPSNGIKLKTGTTINFGKIPELDFHRSCTITFWINTKGQYLNKNEYDNNRNKLYILFRMGNTTVYRRSIQVGYMDSSVDEAKTNDIANIPHASMNMSKGQTMLYSDGWYFVALVIDSDGYCDTYINGNVVTTDAGQKYYTLVSGHTWEDFSDGDFVIGDEELNTFDFVSDIKIYNRTMTNTEIAELYRGI